MTNCPYNALTNTGSLHGHDAGYIRFFCNGFLDLIERDGKFFDKREDKKCN
jgi:hypothetical protein